MDNVQELLFRLSEACCIRGQDEAADVVRGELDAMGIPHRRDALGNVIAEVLPGEPGKHRWMLDAHIDEIGMIVTSVGENGFLRVAAVGGVDLRVLAGHEVTVFGSKSPEPLFGVFCCQPPHLTKAEERGKASPLSEMAVDIGMDRAAAEKAVLPGDLVFLRRRPAALLNGEVTGKALDNRAGAAAVLLAARALKGETGFGLTAVFSLAEELGERGATTGAFGVDPDFAIVVDTSFGRTPDTPAEHSGEMRRGPMIGVSPTLDRGVTDAMTAAGREKGIPFQYEVMGGRTGTNADVVSVSRAGVRTGLVSVPLRYMHTANEIVAVCDVENTGRLMAAAIRRMEGRADA